MAGAPKDLIPLADWLVDKKLLVENATPDEIKKAHAWVKRHLNVQLYSMKRGYTQISKLEMDRAYAAFESKYDVVFVNKERAALKLNAKNASTRMFNKLYKLETKDQRKDFFETRLDLCKQRSAPEGKNAWEFFFAAFLYAHPAALLGNQQWAFVKPLDKLKELLEVNKERLKLDPHIWALVNEIPADPTLPPLEEVIIVAASPDNKGITAKEHAELQRVNHHKEKRGRKRGIPVYKKTFLRRRESSKELSLQVQQPLSS